MKKMKLRSVALKVQILALVLCCYASFVLITSLFLDNEGYVVVRESGIGSGSGRSYTRHVEDVTKG